MRLKQLRKQRNISQLKLAIDLNMTQNTISRYENGVREADYATLIKFADYFNVSIDYLLERTENPTMQKWPEKLCYSGFIAPKSLNSRGFLSNSPIMVWQTKTPMLY